MFLFGTVCVWNMGGGVSDFSFTCSPALPVEYTWYHVPGTQVPNVYRVPDIVSSEKNDWYLFHPFTYNPINRLYNLASNNDHLILPSEAKRSLHSRPE